MRFSSATKPVIGCVCVKGAKCLRLTRICGLVDVLANPIILGSALHHLGPFDSHLLALSAAKIVSGHIEGVPFLDSHVEKI